MKLKNLIIERLNQKSNDNRMITGLHLIYQHYECIKTHVSENVLFNVLMVLDTASFMYTLLKNVKIDFNKLIVLTGCDTAEKKKILKRFFKVYDYSE